MDPDEANILFAEYEDKLISMTGIGRGNSPKTRHGTWIWGIYLNPSMERPAHRPRGNQLLPHLGDSKRGRGREAGGLCHKSSGDPLLRTLWFCKLWDGTTCDFL